MKYIDEASFKTAVYLTEVILEGTSPKPNHSAEKGTPLRCAYLCRRELSSLIEDVLVASERVDAYWRSFKHTSSSW
jgi:hypothetical protein